MFLHKLRIFLLLAAGITLPCHAEVRYSVTFIPSSGGAFCEGYAVNAQGQVAGNTSVTGSSTPSRAMRFSSGITQNLGLLSSGVDSYGRGINSAGEVVGFASVGGGNTVYHAFIYTGGVMQDLGTLGGSFSSASGINDSGTVVGHLVTTGGAGHAFVYSNGNMTDLGPQISPTTNSTATGINNSGQIVGIFASASNKGRAFIYTNGHVTDFSPAAESDCISTGINGGGEAIGYLKSTGASFLYSRNSTRSIPLNEAQGINDAGQIVGSNWVGVGPTKHAFIYQSGKAEDLNSLIPSTGSWILYDARAINNIGQIVGSGTSHYGYGTFLLTPLPTPRPGSAPRIRLDDTVPKRTPKARILVSGTVTGNVTKVSYRVGTRGQVRAVNGTSTWKCRIRLSAGRNRILITASNSSKEATKSFVIVRQKRPLR